MTGITTKLAWIFFITCIVLINFKLKILIEINYHQNLNENQMKFICGKLQNILGIIAFCIELNNQCLI
jgi:hypothetical protein